MSMPERTPTIGSLIRLAAQAMNGRLAAWIAESGFTGIQPAHSAAVQPLWELPEGARVTTLARAARITKQSMSALVDQLEAGGYVERVPDPDDARAIRVRLTAKGKAYGRAVRAFSKTYEAELAAQLGGERVEALRSALQHIVAADG